MVRTYCHLLLPLRRTHHYCGCNVNIIILTVHAFLVIFVVGSDAALRANGWPWTKPNFMSAIPSSNQQAGFMQRFYVLFFFQNTFLCSNNCVHIRLGKTQEQRFHSDLRGPVPQWDLSSDWRSASMRDFINRWLVRKGKLRRNAHCECQTRVYLHGISVLVNRVLRAGMVVSISPVKVKTGA